MKKPFNFIVLLAIALMATVPAFAQSEMSEAEALLRPHESPEMPSHKVSAKGTEVTIDYIKYVVDGDSATLTNGKNCSGAVSIPSSITYNGTTYRVTTIRSLAFDNCTSLTSVTIPNSVTTIGYEAFYNCESLTKVVIGNGLQDMSVTAFIRCTNLKGFLVDNSNPYFSSAGGVLFNKNGNKLIAYPNAKGSTYEIPSSVDSIGNWAFGWCGSFTSVTIPNSVTTIGDYAFYECTSLTSVTFGNSVTTIGDYAFYECTSLTSATIGNSVTTIGDWSFDGCISLTSVTIPNSVTSIGNSAFNNCTSLTSVTIGNSVTTIGNTAFSGCNKLTSVTIGNSVTTIGYRAFYYCKSLTSVAIPNSVTTIGNYAFSYCTSLKTVFCNREEPLSISSNVFENVPISEATLYVPKGCVPAYQSANVWKDFRTITDVIATITIDTITYGIDIECNAILINGRYCSGALVIPSSITYEGVIYPVTAIADSAFYCCNTLTSVTIPNSVTAIGKEAFYNCGALTKAVIGSGLKDLGQGAFSYCLNMKGLEVDKDNSYFSDVDGVLFNKAKTKIVAYPNAKGSTYVVPSTVDSIGVSAFYMCNALTSVTISDRVSFIGNYAFCGCSTLSSFTIPSSITSIGNRAFYNCSSLKTVYCKREEPLSISSGVFDNVPKSEATLVVPKGCVPAYQSADVWKNFGTITERFISKGDLNEDGLVNVTDVTALTAYILGTGTLPDFEKADLNEDFNINVSDVVELMKIILGAE